jgi:hypothetical protein
MAENEVVIPASQAPPAEIGGVGICEYRVDEAGMVHVSAMTDPASVHTVLARALQHGRARKWPK